LKRGFSAGLPTSAYFHIDSTAPILRDPVLSRTPIGTGGRWFVDLAGSDAMSGIATYVISEGISRTVINDSIYVLRDQSSGTHALRIRAYDAAGNERRFTAFIHVPGSEDNLPFYMRPQNWFSFALIVFCLITWYGWRYHVDRRRDKMDEAEFLSHEETS
jgi:hypothetical protein